MGHVYANMCIYDYVHYMYTYIYIFIYLFTYMWYSPLAPPGNGPSGTINVLTAEL